MFELFNTLPLSWTWSHGGLLTVLTQQPHSCFPDLVSSVCSLGTGAFLVCSGSSDCMTHQHLSLGKLCILWPLLQSPFDFAAMVPGWWCNIAASVVSRNIFLIANTSVFQSSLHMFESTSSTLTLLCFFFIVGGTYSLSTALTSLFAFSPLCYLQIWFSLGCFHAAVFLCWFFCWFFPNSHLSTLIYSLY